MLDFDEGEFLPPPQARDLLDKLKRLQFLKKEIKDHEAYLEENKKDAAALEAECVILMDNAGVSQTKIDGVTIYRKTDKYASVDKDKFSIAAAWLGKNGLDFLVKETINSRSLMSALKDLPEEVIAQLPDAIKISPVERVGFRGLK